MSSATPHRIDPPTAEVPSRRGLGLLETHSSVDLSPPAPAADHPRDAGENRCRVDTAHWLAPTQTDLAPTQTDLAPTQTDSVQPDFVTSDPHASDPPRADPREGWLNLHSADLVEQLQAWASDLDAREAQLNARASLQDHRERRFRMRQQDVESELAEQRRSIERLRSEVKAQARRLAFLAPAEAEMSQPESATPRSE